MRLFENNINTIDKAISIYYNRKKSTFNGCNKSYDDVKQDSYIDIYKSLKKYDNNKGEIVPFIYAITEKSILTQIRDLNRDKRKINFHCNDDNMINFFDSGLLLDSNIELKEIINNKLTDKEIQVIKLLYSGYNTVEIGEIMRYTPANIRSIRNKVRRKLELII